MNQRVAEIKKKLEKVKQGKIRELKGEEAEELTTKDGEVKEEKKDGEKAKPDTEKKDTTQKSKPTTVQKGPQNRRPTSGPVRTGDRNRGPILNRPQNRFPRNR